MMKKNFIFFASCLIVKGIKRSTICDLQRGDLYFIPNQVAELLLELKNNNYTTVIDKYKDDEKIIKEYINYFIDNELGFWCNDPESYPDIEMIWDSPEIINNAIIEVSSKNELYLPNVIEQLISLKCKNIEIRVYVHERNTLETVQKMLEKCSESCIRYITLYIQFESDLQFQKVLILGENFKRLNEIVVHGVPFDKELNIPDVPYIYVTNQKINNSSHCGLISSKLFAVNLVSFSESQHFNNCLNRKVSICINGDIKNCPSTNKVFGNIKDDLIREIVTKNNFQELWNISKDQIDICKNCEFRYVCTDCRAYIEEPENIYSKPLKCGYNPDTMQWINWEEQERKIKVANYYNINLTNSLKNEG